MKETTCQALATLWLMPEAELDTYLDVAGQIRSLRNRIEPGSLKSEISLSSATPLPVLTNSNAMVRRAPLRDPKPGSLRAVVHDVLRQSAGPMRRAEVIKSVASTRNDPINDILKAKVGDVLNNRHDPFIEKLAHGVYALTTDQGKKEILCA